MTTTTEQTLISLLKKGSKPAFDRIYQMYAKRLYAFCLQYTKSTEDAEEIVQDVFVRLWFNRENIRQEESLRALLFIMAKNQLINAYRATINSPIYEDYIQCQNETGISHTHHHIEYKEFVALIKRKLRSLPETQQRVIELSRFSDLTNKEIAQKLSLSEQTIKNQLSVGLKSLKGLLNEAYYLLWLLLFVN